MIFHRSRSRCLMEFKDSGFFIRTYALPSRILRTKVGFDTRRSGELDKGK